MNTSPAYHTDTRARWSAAATLRRLIQAGDLQAGESLAQALERLESGDLQAGDLQAGDLQAGDLQAEASPEFVALQAGEFWKLARIAEANARSAYGKIAGDTVALSIRTMMRTQFGSPTVSVELRQAPEALAKLLRERRTGA